MFALELTLLTGRYVATAYNDRSSPEWPPHPARLFSALVASHADTGDPEERQALQWLERLPPPQIAGSDASARELVTVFVPVNDTTVVGLDDAPLERVRIARAERDEAKAAGEPKRLKRAEAELEKLEVKLANQVSAALANQGAPSATDLENAPRLLPELRGRQPRTFPSVRPNEDRIVFSWPEAEPGLATRKALDDIAARVTRLGHSSSLVSLRVVDDAGIPKWRPDDEGELKLRVTAEGQLARLDRAFERHRETESGRVMPCSFAAYTARPVIPGSERGRSVFSDEWIVFRRVGGPRLVATSAASLAKTIRAALLKSATQPPPEILTGHRDRDLPTDRAHLAIVPLPFVGRPEADATLLGFALLLPRQISDGDRRAVFQAISSWERSSQNASELPVHLGRSGTWRVQRLEDEAEQFNLRPEAWCRPVRRWISATPVALDRHPGNLHDSDAARQAKAYSEAEATIRAACAHVGLPAPTNVEVLSFAPLAGARKAKHYPPFPEEPGRTRRQLVHAAIEFPYPVQGPVLLGAGRYVGLGLFRPVTHE